MDEEKFNETQEITKYWSTSTVANTYDKLWGYGKIHLGYFPHLKDATQPKLTFIEAAPRLTEYMIHKGVITSKSNVIEFGCGKGIALIDVVRKAHCSGVGIDLTLSHIEQAKYTLDELKVEQHVQFEHSSFLDLDKKHFDTHSHVFSQVAIYNHSLHFCEKKKKK
eukprot:440181_1